MLTSKHAEYRKYTLLKPLSRGTRISTWIKVWICNSFKITTLKHNELKLLPNLSRFQLMEVVKVKTQHNSIYMPCHVSN